MRKAGANRSGSFYLWHGFAWRNSRAVGLILDRFIDFYVIVYFGAFGAVICLFD